jgi:hypothetical protein
LDVLLELAAARCKPSQQPSTPAGVSASSPQTVGGEPPPSIKSTSKVLQTSTWMEKVNEAAEKVITKNED